MPISSEVLTFTGAELGNTDDILDYSLDPEFVTVSQVWTAGAWSDYSFKVDGDGQSLFYAIKNSGQTRSFGKLGCSFYVPNTPGAPSSGTPSICGMAVSLQFPGLMFGVDSDMYAVILDLGGLKATGTVALVVDTQYYAILRGDGVNLKASLTIYASDGSTVIDTIFASGLEVTTTAFSGIAVGCSLNTGDVVGGPAPRDPKFVAYVDDLVFAGDNTDLSVLPWVPKVEETPPDAVGGTHDAWTASAGNKWDCVDELPYTAADWIEETTYTEMQCFTRTSGIGGAPDVYGVEGHWYGLKEGGTCFVKGWSHNATPTTSTTTAWIALGLSYALFRVPVCWAQDPDGNDWTVASFDALAHTIYQYVTNDTSRITYMQLGIVYEGGPGDPGDPAWPAEEYIKAISGVTWETGVKKVSSVAEASISKVSGVSAN